MLRINILRLSLFTEFPQTCHYDSTIIKLSLYTYYFAVNTATCHHLNCNTRSRHTCYTAHGDVYNPYLDRQTHTKKMFKCVYLIVCVLCLFYIFDATYILLVDLILDPLYGFFTFVFFDRVGTAADQ